MQGTTPLGCTATQLVVPTAATAETTTVAGVDLKDFVDELLVIMSIKRPNAVAGTHSVTFKDSPDNSTFTAVSGGPTALTTPTFAAVTTATETTATVSINTRAIQRYLQVAYITIGTTATYNTSVVAVGLKQVV